MTFFDFQSRQVTQLGTVENTVRWTNTPGFAISPEGRGLLSTSLESTDADLVLSLTYHSPIPITIVTCKAQNRSRSDASPLSHNRRRVVRCGSTRYMPWTV